LIERTSCCKFGSRGRGSLLTDPYCSQKIAAYRAGISGDPSWVHQSIIPLSKVLSYGRIVIGEVSRVDQATKQILFKDDEDRPPINYDILVAAVGVSHLSPVDVPGNIKSAQEMARHLQRLAEETEAAGHIHIVGAGPSAIELAGEIRHKHPTKPITLITADSAILTSMVTRMSSRFARQIQRRLVEMNINILYQECVVTPSARSVAEAGIKYQSNVDLITRGPHNLSITCDLLIWAAPYLSRAALFPDEWLNELGEINVHDTFLVGTKTDVFAFGDVTSIPEPKQACSFPAKVPVLVHNICKTALAMQKPKPGPVTQSLRRYRFREDASLCLSLGPERGVTQLASGLVFGDRATRKWKCRHLFADKFWKLLTDEHFDENAWQALFAEAQQDRAESTDDAPLAECKARNEELQLA
jgi:NADH dehydrogenase FAD-containing subunit